MDEKDRKIAELEAKLRAVTEEHITAREQTHTLKELLTTLSNEVRNILDGSETGAMCLDRMLCIKSATPIMQKHFNLISGDVGRPINNLQSNLLYNELEHDAREVMSSSRLKETIIYSRDGRCFNIRILPDRQETGEINGVILTTTNVTKLKNMEKQLRDNGDRLLSILSTSPIVAWNQDLALKYTWIYNPHPGFNAKDVVGKTDEEMLPEVEAANLTRLKRSVLESGVGRREIVITTIEGKKYYYDLMVEPLLAPDSKIIGISCTSVLLDR